MGVLVGTALIVIIPEGVETLYSANGASPHAHRRRDDHSAPPSERMGLEARASPLLHLHEHPFTSQWHTKRLDLIDDTPNPAAHAIEALPGPVIPESAATDSTFSDPPKTPTEPGKISILETDTSKPPSSSPSPEIHQRTPHAWIGLSLILGFILMYLIDALPHLASPARASPRQNIYSLSDLSTASSPTERTPSPSRSLSTTLGLCIHAAADGIALGASSSSSTTKGLSFIIFLAIMVHKAPAAFGLTAVLLKQGLGKRAARAHLVVFSLAAPAGALATWMVVRTLGAGGPEAGEETMRWWTGLLLLFSGGTFL
jgi:zinc transporter 9